MKNLLVSALGVAMLAGLVSAGGCVSKEEYDKLWAMNRKANEELTKCQDRLRLAESDNQRLQGELADRDRTIKFQADQIAALTGQNRSLQASLDDALKKLGQPVAVAPTPLPEWMNKLLREFAEKYPDLVEFDPKNGVVRFKSDLTFDPGSVTIKPAALAALKKFAEIVTHPEAKAFNVYIAGHTDDIPIVKPETKAKYGTNWGLSAARAESVIKSLYEDKVEQERMGGVFFSKWHPIAPNAAGNKGNVANRRVEIWIVNSSLLLTVPTGTVSAGTSTEGS